MERERTNSRQRGREKGKEWNGTKTNKEWMKEINESRPRYRNTEKKIKEGKKNKRKGTTERGKEEGKEWNRTKSNKEWMEEIYESRPR